MKKINFTKLLLIGAIYFIPNLVIGQSTIEYSEKEKVELIDLYKSIEGTYQIQLIDVRYKPSIHISIAEEIVENRGESENNYIMYNDDIRILILPKSVIELAGFKQIERVKYISTDDLK
tara:strand:+ start:352 stop:708 length:357 start_codon:yes stop_codon:yes gene_type:complete